MRPYFWWSGNSAMMPIAVVQLGLAMSCTRRGESEGGESPCPSRAGVVVSAMFAKLALPEGLKRCGGIAVGMHLLRRRMAWEGVDLPRALAGSVGIDLGHA